MGYTDLLHLVNTTHPEFIDAPNLLVFPQAATVVHVFCLLM